MYEFVTSCQKEQIICIIHFIRCKLGSYISVRSIKMLSKIKNSILLTLCIHDNVGTGGAQGAHAPPPSPIFLIYCEMVSQSIDLD